MNPKKTLKSVKPSLKPDFDKVAERYEAWWANSSLGDRPIICGREVCNSNAPERPGLDRPRDQRELDPQWQLANARWWLDSRLWLADSIPTVFPDFAHGLCIPGVFIGASITFRQETTWINEMPDVYDRDLPDFSADHPVFRSLDESFSLMGRDLGGQALLTVPNLLDGLTTLSQLRGAEQLCLDLIERPDDVLRVANHLDRVALAAHAAFWKTLRSFGQNQTVTWADIYTPGKCEMPQCDFGVNLSPEMFDRFAMPGLRMWAEYFDRSCYHLDGQEQWRFIDSLCTIPKFQSIQWVPGDVNRDLMRYIEYLREIRRRGRCIWLIAHDTQSPVELTRAMGSPDGLMFYMRNVTSSEDINRMIEQLEAVCR